LFRARMEIHAHQEIDYEITALAVLLVAMTLAFILAKKRK